MATVSFIHYSSQSAGALKKAADYVTRDDKTLDKLYVSGQNCTPQLACPEFIATREAHHKQSPVWFYHYVQQNWDSLSHLIEQWMPRADLTGQQISKMNSPLAEIEEEIEAILMERIRDKANTERYDRMIEKRETEMETIRKQISDLENIGAVLRSRQVTLKRNIRMIDSILENGELTEEQIRMLVERIFVHESDGKIDLDIRIKAPFRGHLDEYEDGECTGSWGDLDFDWDRLAKIIYGEDCAG